MELLLGCGSSRVKKLARPDRSEWSGLVTADMNPAHHPDIVLDLDQTDMPFPADTFHEIHAYDTLEHCGRQGDWRFFFAQWMEFWRILKPDGVFYGISPHHTSPWAWGDPGHTRVITAESFVFLAQPSYAQVGTTPMTDYRFCWSGDFDLVHSVVDEIRQFQFALKAIKPARVMA